VWRRPWDVFNFTMKRVLIAISALAVGLGLVRGLSHFQSMSPSTFMAVGIVIVLMAAQLWVVFSTILIALAATLFLAGILLATAFVIGVDLGELILYRRLGFFGFGRRRFWCWRCWYSCAGRRRHHPN
jgi:hypothetical protein